MEPIKTRTADAFKMSLEAGELVIEFGNVVGPGQTPGPTAVAITDRVILPLDTGRRLVHSLEDCLKPHAAALRAEEAKALPSSEAAVAARSGQAPVRPSPEAAGERAAELLRMVGDLGIPHHYERSFKICRQALLANRFLLTVDAGNIPGNPGERTLEICDRLHMPGAAREAAAANFAMAKCVHFGFEADDDSIICKLYLERAVPGRRRNAPARAASRRCSASPSNGTSSKTPRSRQDTSGGPAYRPPRSRPGWHLSIATGREPRSRSRGPYLI